MDQEHCEPQVLSIGAYFFEIAAKFLFILLGRMFQVPAHLNLISQTITSHFPTEISQQLQIKDSFFCAASRKFQSNLIVPSAKIILVSGHLLRYLLRLF